MAQAQRERELRRGIQALAHYDRLLAANPGDAEAYRLRALTLAELGASKRALELYRAHPDWFQAGEGTRLRADYIARQIVWGLLQPESETTRLDEMRHARTELLALLATVPPDSAVGQRLRNDDIIALNALTRHDEVIAVWRQANAQGRELPLYTQVPIADSLLARRHPEAAAQVLEGVLAQTPNHHEAQILLVYAYLESERFDAAYGVLERMRDTQPTWLRQPGAKQDYANWRRYDADTIRSLVDAFAHALQTAQGEGEALVGVGAMDDNLQSSLGSIYGWRGWGERALERQRIARTLAPANPRARVGEVNALLDLDRTGEARPLNAELQWLYPDNIHARRTEERWQRRQGWQLLAESAWGKSDSLGDSPVTSPLGSRDATHLLRVESPLLDDRWRLTAHYGQRYGDFQNERVRFDYLGAGVLYINDRLRWTLDAARALDDYDDGLTFGATAQWRFSDVLRGRLEVWRKDPEASLQARRFGITADSAMVGLRWTPSESTDLDAAAQHLRYDDGNRRDFLSLRGRQRLLARPHFLLDAFGGVATSRASRDDAPYFNPSRDAAVELGLRGDQIVWRRYERHFRHRLSVSGVHYWQEGFGAAWIPVARYEHEWQFAPGHQLSYGFNWSRPVYDGNREERFGFDIRYAWGEE